MINFGNMSVLYGPQQNEGLWIERDITTHEAIVTGTNQLTSMAGRNTEPLDFWIHWWISERVVIMVFVLKEDIHFFSPIRKQHKEKW